MNVPLKCIDGGSVAGELASPITTSMHEIAKHNLTPLVDPTANDDENAGYTRGSKWVNTLTGTYWICYDATATAAKWICGGFLEKFLKAEATTAASTTSSTYVEMPGTSISINWTGQYVVHFSSSGWLSTSGALGSYQIQVVSGVPTQVGPEAFIDGASQAKATDMRWPMAVAHVLNLNVGNTLRMSYKSSSGTFNVYAHRGLYAFRVG